VKRVIQQTIQNPLATELLRGEYPEGSTIEVDVDGEGDEFLFRRTDGAVNQTVGSRR
jgi:ATP-dependent Clp protease ATP-binding subunit ClpB